MLPVLTIFSSKKMSKTNRKEMSNRPGQQKTWPEAQPEAPANSFKKPIQNSTQQPKNGASAACGASVVVLNFVSVFCRNLLELLAELLAKFFAGLDYLTFLFDFFSTFSSMKKLSKPTKIFLAKSIFPKSVLAKTFSSQTGFSDTLFSQIGFPSIFPPKTTKKSNF